MSKGLFLVGSNDFFELKEVLIIGKGPGCDITFEGDLAPKQLQVYILGNETFINNLEPSLPVSVNKKILPDGFYIFLSNLSLIEFGGIQLIYSEEGPPRAYQIKKVLEENNMVDPSPFDKNLLQKAEEIKNEIEKLTKKIKPVITEMQKIKNEISVTLKEKDQKTKDYELEVKKYHLLIQDKKKKFDQIKSDNAKDFDELNKKKLEIAKVLKEASLAKASTKLELDK